MADVYFDSCCFIDLIKEIAGLLPDERRDDVWYYKRFLEAARKKEVRVCTSFLTFAECTHAKDGKDKRILNDEVKEAIESYFFGGKAGVTPVQPSIFVMERMRELAWDNGVFLRGFDSVHIASAIEAGCVEFFTTDDRIGQQVRTVVSSVHGMTVCRSKNTAVLPPKYLQQELDDGKSARQGR